MSTDGGKNPLGERLTRIEVLLEGQERKLSLLAVSLTNHENKDDQHFDEVFRKINELQLSGARLVGYATGIVALLSIVSTGVTIWAALR